jgi:hypothetical protein
MLSRLALLIVWRSRAVVGSCSCMEAGYIQDMEDATCLPGQAGLLPEQVSETKPWFRRTSTGHVNGTIPVGGCQHPKHERTALATSSPSLSTRNPKVLFADTSAEHTVQTACRLSLYIDRNCELGHSSSSCSTLRCFLSKVTIR